MSQQSLTLKSRWTITPTFMGESRVAFRHSLLRILSLSHRDGLDPARTLELFSREHWGIHRQHLYRLVDCLKRGNPLRKALEESHNCCSEYTLLALKLGECLGTESYAWKELVEWEKPMDVDSARLTRGTGAYWTIAATVISLIAIFIISRPLPRIIQIRDEFNYLEENGIRTQLENVTLLLLLTCVGVMSSVVFYIVWKLIPHFYRSSVTKWLTRFFSRHTTRISEGELLRLLAMNLDAGVDLDKTIRELSEIHPDARMRKRLTMTRQRIESGNDPWLSMVDAKILNCQECSAIKGDNRLEVSVWVLRHLSLKRREEVLFGSLRSGIWIQPAIALFFGLFALSIAYLVFDSLSSLVQTLAERHG